LGLRPVFNIIFKDMEKWPWQ